MASSAGRVLLIKDTGCGILDSYYIRMSGQIVVEFAVILPILTGKIRSKAVSSRY